MSEFLGSSALSGKRAVVTGGSSGIGMASARAMYHAGVEVTIVGRDASKLEAASAEIGPGVLTVATDLSSRAELAHEHCTPR